jgi:hypothetical protein
MEAKSFNLITQQDTIAAIVADEKSTSFFILNNSDKPDRNNQSTREQGPILLTVTHEGKSMLVRIPVSWVPVDVALQAPKKAIASSAEFQRALASGSIIVLSHDEGRNIINADQDSRDEYARVMAIAQGVNGAGEGYQAASGQREEADDPWANVSPSVKVNVEEVTNSTMSMNEFRSFMRREARSISALDKKYIAEKLPDLNPDGAPTVGKAMPIQRA